MKYKIKVSWNWIYDDIEAESWPEAKQKALSLASERVEQDNMIAEEYQAPRNWREIAEEEAKTITEELEQEITEAVAKWKTEYWDIINTQAYDALQGAIISFTEDEIKNKIISLLNK